MYEEEIKKLTGVKDEKQFRGKYKEAAQSVAHSTGLSIRQVRAIKEIIAMGNTSEDHIKMLLDRSAYTKTRASALYKAGLTDLIPSTFFSDDDFLRGNHIIYLPNGVFEGEEGLAEFTVPKDIRYIGSAAFKGCAGLKRISFPDTLTHIGKSAFRDCARLEHIVLPKDLSFLGSKCFEGCAALKEISLPQQVKYVPYRGFKDCISLASVFSEAHSVGVSARAFMGCTSLSEFSPVVTGDIGAEAFMGCVSLTFLSINSESIGHGAFKNCRSMTDLYMTYSPKEMKGDVFSGCDSLEFITVGDYSYRINVIKDNTKEMTPDGFGERKKIKVYYEKLLTEALNAILDS